MKLADISGTKENLKAKIEKLETNSKIKNIRDLYTGVNDFQKGYQPKTNERMRRVIWLQTPTVFWLVGGTISHGY